MNFYFSLFQLIETVERLHRNVEHLAGRALRISPRDARANRELLEQCEMKVTEARTLLTSKTHVSKITLRKAAILFQILEITHRRLTQLASATTSVGPDDDNSMKTIWQLLALAQNHYRTLVKTLFDLTGIPVELNLGMEDTLAHDFTPVLQKESSLQQETLKLLEKAIEVFGEEQELAETLAQMRKELLDTKKRFKHLNLAQPSMEKTMVPSLAPAVSKN